MPKTAGERKRMQRAKNASDPGRKQRKLDALFMFGKVYVAVIVDLAGRIWFKGVDLARAMEMADPQNAVSANINPRHTKSYEELTFDSRQYRNIPNLHPKTTFVNELGMNKFVLRSRMPKADAFADWVCGEVLPSIRLTGSYQNANERALLGSIVYLYRDTYLVPDAKIMSLFWLPDDKANPSRE